MAGGILVPQPGIKPAPTALEVWSLNRWTIKEISTLSFIRFSKLNSHFMTPQ